MQYIIFVCLLSLQLLIGGVFVYAQGGVIKDGAQGGLLLDESVGRVQGGVNIENPIIAKNITQLFMTIIDVLLVFAVPLIVFFIIYAGFLYVTARGNESTIQKAHAALLFALVGGVIILGAKVLITVISGTVDSFQP
jgi:hypothetical protein